MDHFRVIHPIILVDKFLSSNEQIKLFKICSNMGQKIYFNFKDNHQHQSFIVFTELQNFKWEIHTGI